ncbi:iron-sulfur cluster assembly accessory protein [Candidatus Peregrinibacteria bacterium CG11_big_fil_rev_8_21_14_0_20_41_10]|nr:MAG: iron-sulfur cluster assembly accessory protein [Candidatus Peregrinibacteria bacterium CG11_big_fil_rev_8_21_14_0_20_41_10]PIZ73182.1 MAG: iron-sulfur cluster assembly accessory protein [Candidatus Peregrinibacteria bacterium CG_4_10_14_0_2_um_filter_41_8]PJC38470.1 MAG: iron-sulfur cluster assembly accessory protein [Candidatus Peregrinibacteria bacterium CG_4_9_14_0_2_um_filter_41_14]
MLDSKIPPIKVTEKAAKFIKQMADSSESEPNLSLKVLPGGCSGLKYAMEFIQADDVRSTDIKVEAGEATIYIDGDSLPYIVGASIDTDSDLMSPGLKIDNPNASANCGCGKSFN